MILWMPSRSFPGDMIELRNPKKGGIQMSNRVNLRIDFAFKQLFGAKGNENILMGFLNAVLQKTLPSPITSLTLEIHKE